MYTEIEFVCVVHYFMAFLWQFILQPFFRFSYITSSSLNSPGEPPMAFVEYFFLIKEFEKNHI